MEWLEPWSSTEESGETYLKTFADQLALETRHGHILHGVPVRLIGRGDGDDALFELLDGTGRVAQVHLVWQGQQKPPWPMATIFSNLDEWRVKSMVPDHREWTDE